MYDTHSLDNLFLHLGGTFNVERCQEVVGYSNQSIFGPALEPIHGATGDQTRELEGAGPEFFTNLKWKTIFLC